jgi:DnaJ-domain-containing protein 1
VWSLLSHEQRRAFHVLDLDPACSSDEAARRYRELAMEHHPDRGGDARAMGVLNRAYSEVRQLLAPSPSGTNPTAAGS